MRPVAGAASLTCGFRYQEGDGAEMGTPLCECGTVRICECVICGQPLCGDHRWERDGRWLCRVDALAFDDQKAAEAEAEAEAHAATYASHIESLSDIPDPIERFLRILGPLAKPQFSSDAFDAVSKAYGAVGSSEFRDLRIGEIAAALCPDELVVREWTAEQSAHASAASERNWDSATIASWFARTAPSVLPFDVSFTEITQENRILRGGMSEREKGRHDAWVFNPGLQQGGLLVLDDGRLSTTSPVYPADASRREVNGGMVGSNILLLMGERLGYAVTL
jgi:hypothetical protein